MRSSLFVVILLFIHNVVAQTSDVVFSKCDSFQLISNGEKAILYKKNKTSIVDAYTKKVLVKPTKSRLLYIDEKDLFLEIDDQKLNAFYIQNNGRVMTYNGGLTSKLRMSFPLETDERFDSLFLFNGVHFNYKTNEKVDQFYSVSEMTIERVYGNLLTMNYVQEPIEGENEFDQDILLDSGFTKSGVYDLERQKWIVPQIYDSCIVVDSTIFCVRVELNHKMSSDGYHGQIEKTFLYDQYQMINGVPKLVAENAGFGQDLDLNSFFGVDSVSTSSEGALFITYKNEKQGLCYLSLFGFNKDGTSFPKFKTNELLPAKFDFVLFEERVCDQIITYQKNEENPIQIYSRNEIGIFEKVLEAKKNVQIKYKTISPNQDNILDIECDGKSLSAKENKWMGEVEEIEGIESEIQVLNPVGFDQKIGLTLIKGNLLLVDNYRMDWLDGNHVPLKSVEYPEEDSVMLDLESGFMYAVYPASISGFDKSGIFDLDKKDWFLPPSYHQCHSNEKGFLLVTKKRWPEVGVYWKEYYSFLLNDGAYLFEELPAEQLLEDETHFQFILENFSADIMEELPNMVMSAKDSEITGEKYLAYDKRQGWAVIFPVIDQCFLNPNILTKPKEFVYYSEAFDHYLWLENDSIYAEILNEKYSVSQRSGKIEIFQNYDHNTYSDNIWINLIDSGDTLVLKIDTPFQLNDWGKCGNELSIQVLDGDLIINDSGCFSKMDWLEEYSNDEYDFYNFNGEPLFLEFDHEASSIWRKENGVWQKKTPYYASVQKMENGYLVTTGGFQLVPDSHDFSEIIERPAYTLYLDKELKAVSYYDFFNFESGYIYSFGTQLCLDEHCFLVNNKGELVTTAIWDDFELENGKIKAIRYKNMNEEELWESDDFIEEFKYFELKDQ